MKIFPNYSNNNHHHEKDGKTQKEQQCHSCVKLLQQILLSSKSSLSPSDKYSYPRVLLEALQQQQQQQQHHHQLEQQHQQNSNQSTIRNINHNHAKSNNTNGVNNIRPTENGVQVAIVKQPPKTLLHRWTRLIHLSKDDDDDKNTTKDSNVVVVVADNVDYKKDNSNKVTIDSIGNNNESNSNNDATIGTTLQNTLKTLSSLPTSKWLNFQSSTDDCNDNDDNTSNNKASNTTSFNVNSNLVNSINNNNSNAIATSAIHQNDDDLQSSRLKNSNTSHDGNKNNNVNSLEWLNITCRECSLTGPEAGARAFVLGPTPLSIVICHNRLQHLPIDNSNNTEAALSEMNEILTHELLHVYDIRQLRLNVRDCQSLAYSEVRAAKYAECVTSTNLETCVKNKAWTATHNLFPHEAKKCLQRVFETAYNDTRPFVTAKQQQQQQQQRVYKDNHHSNNESIHKQNAPQQHHHQEK